MHMAQSDDRGAAESRSPKVALGLVALAFAVTLAVVVGNRLSDEALAVLAGAVCGVGAAIPVCSSLASAVLQPATSNARPTRTSIHSLLFVTGFRPPYRFSSS